MPRKPSQLHSIFTYRTQNYQSGLMDVPSEMQRAFKECQDPKSHFTSMEYHAINIVANYTDFFRISSVKSTFQSDSSIEQLHRGIDSKVDVSPITKIQYSRLGLTVIFHSYLHKLPPNIILHLQSPGPHKWRTLL